MVTHHQFPSNNDSKFYSAKRRIRNILFGMNNTVLYEENTQHFLINRHKVFIELFFHLSKRNNAQNEKRKNQGE
jgi:hypothetical protein